MQAGIVRQLLAQSETANSQIVDTLHTLESCFSCMAASYSQLIPNSKMLKTEKTVATAISPEDGFFLLNEA